MGEENEAVKEAERGLKEAEAQEQAIAELRDLESIADDLGLESVDLTSVAARERYNAVVGVYTLGLRLDAVKASVTANKAMHNDKAASQFEDTVKEVDAQRFHALRLIKSIDKANPGAKEQMQRMVERARDKPDVCPKCGAELK